MAIDVNGRSPLFEVVDMPTSFSFYRDVVGFEVVAMNKAIDTDPADEEDPCAGLEI